MITIKNLKVNLGEFLLREINLDIKPGEYFIILGPSGAGRLFFWRPLPGFIQFLKARSGLMAGTSPDSTLRNGGLALFIRTRPCFPIFQWKRTSPLD